MTPRAEGEAVGAVLRVTMPDGSQWDVPLDVIARDRADHYAAREFDGDVERSLAEDTLPLFEEDPSEVSDWAANNMNWEDVSAHAVLAVPAPLLTERDKVHAWSNAPMEVVRTPDPAR